MAKQAAEVDLLTEERNFHKQSTSRMNAVEYEALDMGVHRAGAGVSGEQVQLLRRLWTEQSVAAKAASIP